MKETPKLKASYKLRRPFWCGPSWRAISNTLAFAKVIAITGSAEQSRGQFYVCSMSDIKVFSCVQEAKLWFEVSGEDVCWISKEDAIAYLLRTNRDAFEEG